MIEESGVEALPANPPDRVWYVAYGSNVNRARFLRYLEGDTGHTGARDATPPARSVWTTAALRLRFAGESTRWGGGVCFVDPDPRAVAYVRAWDITGEQFEDVFAQENRQPVGQALDWSAIGAGPASVGESWYSKILPVRVAGLPAPSTQPTLTFTWRLPFPLNRPVAAYRDTIAHGLADHPDLSPAAIAAYLDAAELS